MSSFLFKPIGQGQVGGGKANFLLENTNLVSGGFYDENGNLVERFQRFVGQPEGNNKPGVKFWASKPGGAYGQNLTARFTDSSGKTYEYKIPNGGQRYEGDLNNPESLHAVDKGPQGGGGTAGPAGTGSQQVGQYGVAPGYIGNLFPQAVQTQYQNIPGAAPSYQYIDPIKFGQGFNPYARSELGVNYQQAGQLGLESLNNEFAGLASYSTKAAALKQGLTAADNAGNQATRTAQINAALPGVEKNLEQQTVDAATYARGDVPNEVVNKGLELGVRSAAADVASTSGFGVNSSAARKVSDLMSAKERIALSFQGNQLESQNAQERAAFSLAPTEYNNAGSQINVNPSLSASQLQQANFGAINQNVALPASQAFSTNVQQSQFLSGLIQQTQQFNASNTLQNDQFNANNLNNFALSFFNYLNSYANSVAGAGQTNLNTGVAIDQQNQAQSISENNRHNTQQSNNISSGLGVIGTILGGIAAFSDIRLKENIQVYTTGLKDIQNLEVISYNYKDKTIAADGKIPRKGVIAQEFQKLFPASVGAHESGYLQIDPSELIFALMSAVKELSQRILVLEAK